MQLVGSSRSVSLLLATILCGPPCGLAQSPQPPAPAKATTTAPDLTFSELKIRVLEGDNVINSISLGRSIPPVIEVLDQNGFPVEGASIVFSAPERGPGGTFPGGAHSFTVNSNAQGQATCPFRPNDEPGKFTLTVVATSGTRTGRAMITQTNSTSQYAGRVVPPRPLYKRWYFWAIIAGAAGTGIGVRAANRSEHTTIVITPGGPVFTAP